MIDAALLFANDRIIIISSPIAEQKILSLVQSALKELCKTSVSKVIQVESIRLAISAIKIRDEMIGFGCYGQGTDPKALLDLSTDMAEIYIQKFARLNYNEKSVQTTIAKEFDGMVIEANKKINAKQKLVVEIDDNLKGTTEISKNSLQKMMDRGKILHDLDDSSKALSKQALDFEISGRQLKRSIQRQKLKTYLVLFLIMIFCFVLFFRRLI